MKSKIVPFLLVAFSFSTSFASANEQELLTCLREKDQLQKKINAPLYVCAIQSCSLAVGYGSTRIEALGNAYEKFGRFSPSCSRNEEPVCEPVVR